VAEEGKSGWPSKPVCQDILNGIRDAWNAGRPWSSHPNSRREGRFAASHMNQNWQIDMGMRDQIRTILTSKSSTPTAEVQSWADLGVSLDRSGVLQFEQAKLTTAFDNKPMQAVSALSANATEPAIYTGSASGLAGDIVVKLHAMTKSTGSIANLNSAISDRAKVITDKQTKLDAEIARLQTRYDAQYGALNSILNAFKTTQDGITAMVNANNSKN
jgi:flagellar capping protein FliD